jgi:hypothetical protein
MGRKSNEPHPLTQPPSPAGGAGTSGGSGAAKESPQKGAAGLLTPAKRAATSPGNVAEPTACEKKASLRSTIKAPSTPPATPSSSIARRSKH